MKHSTPTEGLVKALKSFANRHGHWPDCPQRIGTFTKFDGLDEVLTPCSKRCRKAREAIEAAGGTIDQAPSLALGPKDKRSLEDLFGGRPGCRLVPGSEYHQPECRHSAIIEEATSALRDHDG